MIKVENLSKNFGSFEAVNSISFSVNPGEIFGLLGPNGAGKTTTLRMIATLITPSKGNIELCGFNGSQKLEIKKKLGFLTSSTSLYGRLTPVEILRYFGTLNHLEKKYLDNRIIEVISLLGINDFKDKRCEKLSTGQKQRVSIARAILHDPPVLIFDEPTSGLDVISAQIILDFIKDAKKSGKTIVFSTHNMSEADYLCDSLGFIYKGNLIALGTIDSLMLEAKKDTLRDTFLTFLEKNGMSFVE